MQEEKSAVYTVILGVCLLLCLLMLGNMLMGRADTSIAPAAPEEGDAMKFHITEDDIASVLIEALPFPVEDTAVKISRDGTIAVTTAVTRQALTEAIWYPASCARRCCFCRSAASCTARGAQLFKRQTQPCLPDHQAGRLHLAPSRTLRHSPMRSPHSGIPAWNSGTSRRRPYSGRTGKRCCWDNRSQQAKEKSLRKTEGISGM